MSQHPERDRDSTRLSDDSAQRLLARATQLDSARAASTSVAELRRAAAEAGIAPEAFEQALRELDTAPPAAVERSASRSRWRLLPYSMALLMLLAVLAVFFLRMTPR